VPRSVWMVDGGLAGRHYCTDLCCSVADIAGVHSSESAERQHSGKDSLLLWSAWRRQDEHRSVHCSRTQPRGNWLYVDSLCVTFISQNCLYTEITLYLLRSACFPFAKSHKSVGLLFHCLQRVRYVLTFLIVAQLINCRNDATAFMVNF